MFPGRIELTDLDDNNIRVTAPNVTIVPGEPGEALPILIGNNPTCTLCGENVYDFRHRFSNRTDQTQAAEFKILTDFAQLVLTNIPNVPTPITAETRNTILNSHGQTLFQHDFAHPIAISNHPIYYNENFYHLGCIVAADVHFHLPQLYLRDRRDRTEAALIAARQNANASHSRPQSIAISQGGRPIEQNPAYDAISPIDTSRDTATQNPAYAAPRDMATHNLAYADADANSDYNEPVYAVPTENYRGEPSQYSDIPSRRGATNNPAYASVAVPAPIGFASLQEESNTEGPSYYSDTSSRRGDATSNPMYAATTSPSLKLGETALSINPELSTLLPETQFAIVAINLDSRYCIPTPHMPIRRKPVYWQVCGLQLRREVVIIILVIIILLLVILLPVLMATKRSTPTPSKSEQQFNTTTIASTPLTPDGRTTFDVLTTTAGMTPSQARSTISTITTLLPSTGTVTQNDVSTIMSTFFPNTTSSSQQALTSAVMSSIRSTSGVDPTTSANVASTILSTLSELTNGTASIVSTTTPPSTTPVGSVTTTMNSTGQISTTVMTTKGPVTTPTKIKCRGVVPWPGPPCPAACALNPFDTNCVDPR